MTARQRRMAFVALIVAGVAGAAVFALQAFEENLLYYYSPSQVAAGEAPAARAFRVGGLVSDGSVKRESGSMEVRFDVSDYAHSVTISYSGILPDLFREGQGIIAGGRLTVDGTFVAEEVLAKHDENYMPAEVAESLHKGREAAQATTPSGG